MKNIRPNVEEVLGRNQAFHAHNKPGSALVLVRNIQKIDPGTPIAPLTAWDFTKDMKPFLDARVQNSLHRWQQRLDVDDDCIPSEGPWYGIAEHSAFQGGSVDFSDATSWHHPIVEDMETDRNKPVMDENQLWYKLVIDGITYIRERWGDQVAPRIRGTAGPLDNVNALRGNEILTDFYEYPDEVKELAEFSARSLAWFVHKQIDAAGMIGGGVISGFENWMPGRSLGHSSEDVTVMMSPKMFEEFGRPYTIQMHEGFETAFVHTHAAGKQCIPQIASLPKLRQMEISTDPNTPRAIEIFRELRDEIPDTLTVVLELTKDEIRNNLDLLKRGKTIVWYHATDVEDAKEAVALVRKELPWM